MRNFYKNIVLFIVLMQCSPFGGWGAYAQLYPVNLTPIFNVPYSVKISEYANSMDTKMQLLINPTDFAITQKQVRLKLYIQGNRLNIQSSDYIQGQRPIFINGGELQTLTNNDIAALFRLENLQGITAAQYAAPLPDGMYNFCFEMYDFLTNEKLSQKSCGMMYLQLNDPPILNIPAKNEQIVATDFPNILFNWTPRQINATNVSYKFELKQIIDPTLDPQIGFMMAPLLHEETVFSTALLYNLSMPILTPGMRYAWRVKAISTTGLSENAVFKNDGYSEIFSFKYATNCSAPNFLLSQAQSAKSAKITWQSQSGNRKFHVQYRTKGVAKAEWFSVYTQNDQVTLTNLEPELSYEFRVGATCEAEQYGIDPSYVYSNIQEFRMPEKSNAVQAYNCGIRPALKISNQTPLTNLIQSETFTAGDFPVTILELNGKSPYSGLGYVVVPYLADTKIAVEFNNIIINTDYQLINGIVETSYNPEWNNVVDLKDVANDFKGLLEGIKELFTKAEDLEKQKAAGTISEEDYNKNWTAVYEGLEKAREQYKALVNAPDIPEELKKKVADLDPVFVDLASNDYTTKGNENKGNLEKTKEVFEEVEKYISNNCQDLDDGKIVLGDLDDYKIYGTPAGKALVLKGATNLDLESIYPNEAYPDLKVPKGALVAFTKGSYSFKAKYKKELGKWKFIGYFNKEGIEYLDTDSENFRKKLDANGKSMADVSLVLATGASKEFSKSIFKSIGYSEAALAGEGVLSFRNTGIAILAYIIVETFTSPTIITTIEHGEILDLPETTPINTGADNYLKDIPVDLPITIPHAIPKEETGGTCKVYVIWSVAPEGKIETAKYGMTCTDDYEDSCNMRPEKQCIKFEKEKNPEKRKFYYNWVTTDITKKMCHIIEKSLTANYVLLNIGRLPSHHYLPCFIKKHDFDERQDRAEKWLKDKFREFGK